MNTVTEPSLTVEVIVDAPENNPVVVRFADDPESDFPITEAVERIAALVATHARVVVTTRVAGQTWTDEFIGPMSIGQAAPQPPSTPPAAVVVPVEPPKAVKTLRPKPARTESRVRRDRFKFRNPFGRRTLIATATAVAVGVVGVAGAAAVTHWGKREPVVSVVMPWAKPTPVEQLPTASYDTPGWVTTVPKAATVIPTQLGIVVTGDKTFRVVDTHGVSSKKLKLVGNPSFLATTQAGDEDAIVLVDENYLRIWDPTQADKFTTIDLPVGGTVTATGGQVLVRANNQAWTLTDGQLTELDVPAESQAIAVTTDGLVSVRPPAQVLVTGPDGQTSQTRLTNPDGGTITRWLGVTGTHAVVVLNGPAGHLLGMHDLATGDLSVAVRLPSELASTGRWLHSANNQTAVFGHLMFDLAEMKLIGAADATEPFTVLVHDAAYTTVEGAGEWLSRSGHQIDVPDGQEVVGVYGDALISRAGDKVYEWKASK